MAIFLAISESYHLNSKNAKYDLVIATSRFLKVSEDSETVGKA
jgi:hypothetical protein